MLARKVKLDDQSYSLADLWRMSPQVAFRGMNTSLLISVLLGLRCIATGLRTCPMLLNAFFLVWSQKEDTISRVIFAAHTKFSLEVE